jgi:anti-sigma regulatory factor (Ser/Thr protein kinase)
MSDVALLLPAHPEHVRTARLVVVAAARRAGLADELVDELRLAVGEACARAVGLHREDATEERIEITVSDDATGLRVAVADRAAVTEVGDDAGLGDLVDPDLSLALITGLVENADISAGPDGTGTVITLSWPLTSPRPGSPAGSASTQAATSAQ